MATETKCGPHQGLKPGDAAWCVNPFSTAPVGVHDASYGPGPYDEDTKYREQWLPGNVSMRPIWVPGQVTRVEEIVGGPRTLIVQTAIGSPQREISTTESIDSRDLRTGMSCFLHHNFGNIH